MMRCSRFLQAGSGYNAREVRYVPQGCRSLWSLLSFRKPRFASSLLIGERHTFFEFALGTSGLQLDDISIVMCSKLRYSPIPTDANDLWHSIISLYQKRAHKKSQPPPVHRVRNDVQRLRKNEGKARYSRKHKILIKMKNRVKRSVYPPLSTPPSCEHSLGTPDLFIQRLCITSSTSMNAWLLKN